jgi:hypothetical protein
MKSQTNPSEMQNEKIKVQNDKPKGKIFSLCFVIARSLLPLSLRGA